MNRFYFVLVVALFVSGCVATPYKAPESGPTATLSIQQTLGEMRFAGRTYSPIPSNIAIFDLDNDGCTTGMNSGRPIDEETIQKNGQVTVAAKQWMALMVEFADDSHTCSSMQAVQFDAGVSYAIQPIYAQQAFQPAKCGFVIQQNAMPVVTKKVESSGLAGACTVD